MIRYRSVCLQVVETTKRPKNRYCHACGSLVWNGMAITIAGQKIHVCSSCCSKLGYNYHALVGLFDSPASPREEIPSAEIPSAVEEDAQGRDDTV